MFMKPFAVPSRSVQFLPDQPTYPVQSTPDEKKIFRWGYYDRYRRRGLLRHDDTESRVQTLKVYSPKSQWEEKKALFGQNDYIDILGNGEVHPVNVLYDVAPWLRGFHGDELKVLIRRRKFLSKTTYPETHPKKYHELNYRISYLYRFMNRKTRTPLLTRKK